MSVADKGALGDSASTPEHLRLFNLVKDLGLESIVAIAEKNGMSLTNLKQECRRAGDDLITDRGHLMPEEQSVFNWSKL